MVTVIKTLHDYQKKVPYSIPAPVSLIVRTYGVGEQCSPWVESHFAWDEKLVTGMANKVISQGVFNKTKSGTVTMKGYEECNMLPIEEVILFYWPSDPIANDTAMINRSKVFNVAADSQLPLRVVSSTITFDGQDVYPRGMVIKGNYTTLQQGYISQYILPGPFTFTSPTMYIAHRHIKIRHTSIFERPEDFDPSLPGTTREIRGPGVLAVDPKSIFSLRHLPRNIVSGVQFAQLVANGKYDPGWGMEEPYMQIRPMNFTHLKTPVPASVYYEARSEDCFGQQTHCATITVRE
jgi:hypothetical protein